MLTRSRADDASGVADADYDLVAACIFVDDRRFDGQRDRSPYRDGSVYICYLRVTCVYMLLSECAVYVYVYVCAIAPPRVDEV